MKFLYVVSMMPETRAIFAGLLEKRTIPMSVQKYAAENCQRNFSPVWTESLTLIMRPEMVENDFNTDEAQLLTVSGKVMEIQLPEVRLNAGANTASMELRGTYANIFFDAKQRTGVITEAHDYARRLPKQVVAYPQLEVLNTKGFLQPVMYLSREVGLPEKLIKCKELLEELGRHQ